MANDILAHPDEHQYQICLKNLEVIYQKINQSIANLTMLSEWVSENHSCTFSLDNKGMVDGVLCSVIDLLKQTVSFLPEL